MPSFPPRQQPIKKRIQLNQSLKELQIAIKRNLPLERLQKLAEKYRAARLSYCKALLHEIQEKTYQKKTDSPDLANIMSDISKWTEKTAEEIISEIKTELQ